VLHSVTSAHAAYKRDSLKLAARVAAIAAATKQAAATTAALEQSRAQRAAYIGSLATQRQLNERQIAHLVAVAQAAQARSAELLQVRATGIVPPISTPISDTSPAPSTTSDGRTLTVSATGYALGGTTSTGLPVGWGVAAVDPSVIPLGTHMFVPGYGEAVAADTGGAVVGNTIDLWFPSVAQAEQWGRRVVTITLH
jgi:3D (Asp-Asp-Asp) domain-containing protein